MQKLYPFKFLDAYTRQDSSFFFGRDEEIKALYEMVFQTDLLLVYGASGTGKTSLIQCGLASKFQSHDWLALNVRRGKNINESLEKALIDAGGDLPPDDNLDWLERDLSVEDPQGDDAAPLSPLARQFKAIYLQHFKPLYLIFDQFEELYILGDRQEQEQFVRSVQQILRVKQPVKIILSIREEYLGRLYEFERAVPELLRKKLRVEPMNLERVKAVLLGVHRQPASNVRLEQGQEDALAEAVFEKVRGQEKTLHIPLPYLQVFLDKFYLHVTGDKDRHSEAVFTRSALADMGDLGDVLRNFLDEQVAAIAQAENLPESVVWSALSPFVTLEGTKEPLSEAQFAARLGSLPQGAAPRLLQALVQGRILRFSEASQLHEIAHDALAKQIHAKRSDEEIALLEVQRLVRSQSTMKAAAREYFTEKQLLFMEPYLEKLALGDEEKVWIAQSQAYLQQQKQAEQQRQQQELAETRKRLRTVRSLLAVAALAALVAGYFYVDANRQKSVIERTLSQLQEETAEKERQRRIAEEKEREALISAQKAEEERKKAEGLLKDNIEKDKQNRVAVYNRLMAEAQNLQSQRRYEEAIRQLETAKPFASDIRGVEKAIADCKTAQQKQKKFEEWMKGGADHASNSRYAEAIEAYRKAWEMGVDANAVRVDLKDLEITLNNNLRINKENADALGFDPQKSKLYEDQANQLKKHLTEIQNILNKRQ